MRRLHAYVHEAKGLPPTKKDAGLPDVYAKVRFRGREARTRTVRGGTDPVWREEFVFELDEEINAGGDGEAGVRVGVFYDQGEGSELGEEEEVDAVGAVNVPLPTNLYEGVPASWFPLQCDGDDVSRTNKDRGKILLAVLRGRSDDNFEPAASPSNICSPITNMDGVTSTFGSKHHGSLELSDNTRATDESKEVETYSTSSFEEAIGVMQSKSGTNQMPGDLQGGILLDQTYVIEPKDLNTLLFEPNSQFIRALVEKQGTTDYKEGAWTWKDAYSSCLTRSVTYTRAATKLVKAVKATEEQIYLTADGKNFAVLIHVSTPDVPYGSCFQVDMLYKIMPTPQLSASEESQSSRLVISWNVNFSQSTMMKSVIEGSARQGIKESYETFADILAQFVKPANAEELILNKEQLLAPMHGEHQSDWELALEYLCNFTVISTLFMGLYVFIHILLSVPGPMKGLEFGGLDLPDSFGELITCAVLVLQAERVFYLISHFVKARLRRGSDHGIKAQGDGWVLTVALIEGSNLPVISSSGILDPYVVFGCGGQTRTSSVQLQTQDPQWNDILEFDAMQGPPSVLTVDVFDFDGPFDQEVSLGHAEINFVRHTASELADIWVSLDGKLAQASHSQLHLRVFLDNTKGSEAVKEYLTKMEKEVGKKLNLQSPHRNSTFQKLFNLPPEEFLINDFACYLKRRLPLQGRLFLSARIIGFHGNIFGHKTNFFFLWEDIEDIQELSPSFSTVGTPALLIILKSGHGRDAKHGAKSEDKEGRLKFQFQSFASFNSASKTIIALWRNKCLNGEQSAKLEEDKCGHGEKSGKIGKLDDDQSGSSGRFEDSEYILGSDGTRLSKALSVELSVSVESLVEVFGGGLLEKKIMEKVGCLNYSTTPWEAVGPDHVYRRQISYKFNRHISIFGGEVSSIQHKAPSLDHNGWAVDEVMTLHNVPFGDHFHVSLKYILIETFLSNAMASRCDAFLGVTWTKSSKFKKRITRNIFNKLTHRSKEIFELAERENLSSDLPKLLL
ncbi:uncharacterized protein A4U43_C09F16710 [Asparagus officinalis]|uniref:C2 and GRAM domain-containing protein n=1 Tax=Asparagus officinalis TaxID=4686 RepID=A0A5P1E894_ASPOF|nr:C2 and GRAM domain-containing protein At5g50170 [Asparagus officinalis]ONK58794.1 uncharacterized protein A4U43_C09F16710 [Asparagus officinalis]